MCACGVEFRRLVNLTVLLVLAVPAALGQWERGATGRLAALNARPAAVGLTATLESLSVTASPTAANLGEQVDRGANRWAITTAWTIPANCTTVRLSGYPDNVAGAGGFFPGAEDPFSESNDSPDGTSTQSFAPPGAAGSLPGTGIGGITLVNQPMGATSLPGSRTDNISIAIGRSDIRPGTATNPGLTILVQAL